MVNSRSGKITLNVFSPKQRIWSGFICFSPYVNNALSGRSFSSPGTNNGQKVMLPLGQLSIELRLWTIFLTSFFRGVKSLCIKSSRNCGYVQRKWAGLKEGINFNLIGSGSFEMVSELRFKTFFDMWLPDWGEIFFNFWFEIFEVGGWWGYYWCTSYRTRLCWCR